MGIPYSINSSTISILLTYYYYLILLLLKKLIFNVNDYLIYAEMHNHILNGVIILNHLKKDIAKKISWAYVELFPLKIFSPLKKKKKKERIAWQNKN